MGDVDKALAVQLVSLLVNKRPQVPGATNSRNRSHPGRQADKSIIFPRCKASPFRMVLHMIVTRQRSMVLHQEFAIGSLSRPRTSIEFPLLITPLMGGLHVYAYLVARGRSRQETLVQSTTTYYFDLTTAMIASENTKNRLGIGITEQSTSPTPGWVTIRLVLHKYAFTPYGYHFRICNP